MGMPHLILFSLLSSLHVEDVYFTLFPPPSLLVVIDTAVGLPGCRVCTFSGGACWKSQLKCWTWCHDADPSCGACLPFTCLPLPLRLTCCGCSSAGVAVGLTQCLPRLSLPRVGQVLSQSFCCDAHQRLNPLC